MFSKRHWIYFLYMIAWMYSDPQNVCSGYWCNARVPKMLCAPARPANTVKRSGFVNYGIERGQSFNNQVIRVTTSDLQPQNRQRLTIKELSYQNRVFLVYSNVF